MKNGLAIFLSSILYTVAALLSVATAYAGTVTDIIFEDTDGNTKNTIHPGDTLIIRAAAENIEVPDMLTVSGQATSEFWTRELKKKQLRSTQGPEGSLQWRVTLPLVAGTQLLVKLTGRSLRASPVTLYKRLSITPRSEFIDENICSACHSDIVASWERSRHFPEITCQLCHGPAGEHILAPGNPDSIASAGNVTCTSFCHNRTEGGSLRASSGFIAPLQQAYEVERSPHSSIGGCLTCHNPHAGPSSEPARAIRAACISCHSGKKVGMAMEALDCKDCHMPFAVSSDPTIPRTTHPKGTMRSHIFRIKGTAMPGHMIGLSSPSVSEDGSGLFLTLDFACLGCHDGQDAVRLDMNRARQAHTIVHE